MNDTVEINTPENLRKDKFRRKVCIGCAFYCRDRNVGWGIRGGYCDHLGMTKESRLLHTPPDQMYKTCPLRMTRKEWEAVKAAERAEQMDQLAKMQKEPSAQETRGRKSMGRIEVSRINGEVIGIFDKVKEAAAVTGVPTRKVYKLIDGQLKHNDTGYIFRRVEDRSEQI